MRTRWRRNGTQNATSVLYLDASALVKLAVAEPESAALAEALDRETAALVTSVIGGTELARALHARGLADRASRIADPNGLVLRFRDVAVRLAPLTAAIAIDAGSLAPGKALRSLDALHLATARAVGPTLVAVVTYDARMMDAARVLGLPVAAPGADRVK